jgi:Xaa-Pro dipeptidase
MTNQQNPNVFSPQINRQAKLASMLQTAGLDSLVLNPGPSLIYLTGLHFHLSERPVTVILKPGETPVIVLPELELEKTKHLPYPILAFPYGEDPSVWEVAFRRAIQATQLDGKRIGVEPRQLRLLEFRLLQYAAPEAEFISADESVAKLRMFKDESEISAMRKAAEIAQEALQATLPHVKIGCSERELAAELTLQLLRAGCDSQVPFAPIVSGGPNAANPHATPSSRPLSPGDLLVIDWGASYEGYFSDITRTFAIGDLKPEFSVICKIVQEANAAGRAEARPGIPAEMVDRATRSVIESAGYGKYFTHRTGHGLGMEGHEEPYIRMGNQMLLEPGMTFTIEPGIYLPERNGVRIEDDVVITQTGSESLTTLPREVIQLM